MAKFIVKMIGKETYQTEASTLIEVMGMLLITMVEGNVAKDIMELKHNMDELEKGFVMTAAMRSTGLL